jgi:hypothetical protein
MTKLAENCAFHPAYAGDTEPPYLCEDCWIAWVRRGATTAERTARGQALLALVGLKLQAPEAA